VYNFAPKKGKKRPAIPKIVFNQVLGPQKLYLFAPVLRIRIRDPVPTFLTPGYGMGKKSGSGMNNTNHISESLETIFWVKIFKSFDADPG
jgi:hypothetical protein